MFYEDIVNLEKNDVGWYVLNGKPYCYIHDSAKIGKRAEIYERAEKPHG